MAWNRRVRRVFSEEEKQRIVAESKQPDVSVGSVARKYKVSIALLFRWRRQAKERAFAAALEPAAETLEAKPV